MFLLVVSLALNGEYLKGQSIPDVSKFSTQTEVETEEEETIEDDAEEEETIEDDEPEPTGEEENDTVTSVPPKGSFGTDLALKNLTLAPIEDGAAGKLIFASCQKDFPYPRSNYVINRDKLIRCNVPGASLGDNVVVSNTPLDNLECNFIASSQVSEPNVVTILLFGDFSKTSWAEGHPHYTWCGDNDVSGTVIFSIIVFRPTVLDILRPVEELPNLGLDK